MHGEFHHDGSPDSSSCWQLTASSTVAGTSSRILHYSDAFSNDRGRGQRRSGLERTTMSFSFPRRSVRSLQLVKVLLVRERPLQRCLFLERPNPTRFSNYNFQILQCLHRQNMQRVIYQVQTRNSSGLIKCYLWNRSTHKVSHGHQSKPIYAYEFENRQNSFREFADFCRLITNMLSFQLWIHCKLENKSARVDPWLVSKSYPL